MRVPFDISRCAAPAPQRQNCAECARNTPGHPERQSMTMPTFKGGVCYGFIQIAQVRK